MDDQRTATLNAFAPTPPTSFWRENFQLLLVATLFLITFTTFVFVRDPDIRIWLKDICQAFLYGFLAMVGVRARNSAPAIGPATTESGDVNINQPPPADPAKEKPKNEIPSD